MKTYIRRESRVKGSIETFVDDKSMNAPVEPIANRVASITQGDHSIGLTTQTYNSTEEALYFTVSFNEYGSGVVKIVTTYVGIPDQDTVLYHFRTTTDEPMRQDRGYR